MEVAVERPTPVKEEKRADAKPEMTAVRIQYMTCCSSSSLFLWSLVVYS